MAAYMPWILDLICIAVLIGCVIAYYHRGFVGVFLSFAGFLAALVCAVVASRFLSDLVFHRFIREKLIDALMNYQLESDVTKSLAENLIHSLQSLPEWVSGILSLFSIDTGEAVELINGLTNPDTAAIAASLTENLLQPLFLSFLGLVFFIFVFVVLMFLFRRLSELAGGLTSHIPIVGGVNHLLGGAVGVAGGLLWLFLLGVLVSLFVLITSGGVEWLNEDIVGRSYLFSKIYEWVPF